MMTSTFIILALYVIVFVLAEKAYYSGLTAEKTRKIAHIGASLVSFFLPALVDLKTALFLGLIFTFFLFWTEKQQLLNSVHKIKAKSYGAIFFPMGLMLCAAIFWRIDPLIFQVSVLIEGLSDGLAGVLGRRYGRSTYNVTGDKTLQGSFVFFIITFLILLVTIVCRTGFVNSQKIGIVVLSSLVLTVVEGLLGKGWDNLILPPAGGLMIYSILFL